MGTLTPEQSDRLVRVARVLAAAEETFGSREKAGAWLCRPTVALGGERPLHLLDTDEGARRVETLLGRIAHGIAAGVPARRQLAWRLCREPFAELAGEGARRYGGWWNTHGRPLVYAASCAALAVLEVRVQLDLTPDLLPEDYVLVTIELVDPTIEELTELPPDAAAFGDAWLAEGRSAVLPVPSAIVPESSNLLLNPVHPGVGQARIIRRRPFAFDRRLWLPV